MWNWIKFISIFLSTFIIVLIIIVFAKAFSPYMKENVVAEKIAIEEDYLTEVTTSTTYNSERSYATIIGKNKAGVDTAVFIPLTKEDREQMKSYPIVHLASGIKEKEAVARANEEVPIHQVMNVRLGYEDEPVWEVVTKGKKGEMNFVYLSFKDGKTKKKIMNL